MERPANIFCIRINVSMQQRVKILKGYIGDDGVAVSRTVHT